MQSKALSNILSIVYGMIIIIMLVAFARLLTSCTVTTQPDGTTTKSADMAFLGALADKVIERKYPVAPVVPSK